MKLTCDICGGELEMQSGGNKVVCVDCGMTYSVSRVKEKLRGQHKEIKREVNAFRIRVDDVKKPFLSRDCRIMGTVLEGEVHTRDLFCVQGNTMEYKISRCDQNSYPNQVMLYIENADKKDFMVGQMLVPSYRVDEYFRELLNVYFSHYEMEENVHLVDDGVDLNFVLMKNGRPKLGIILCNSRYYDSDEINNTMLACENCGVKVQRYFRDFENEKRYVCNRIRRVL